MHTVKLVKTVSGKVLAFIVSLAMIFAMSPLGNLDYSYAESGGMDIQTPVMLVTGQGLLGGSDYSAANVSNEKSYTLDELKQMEGVNDQKYSARKSDNSGTRNRVYVCADGASVEAMLTASGLSVADYEGQISVLATDNYASSFKKGTEYVNDGKAGKSVKPGLDEPRYYYEGFNENNAQIVPAIISWSYSDYTEEGGGVPTQYPDPPTEDMPLKLVVGQYKLAGGNDEDHGGREDMNYPLYNGGAGHPANRIVAGDAIDETVLTLGSEELTRADVLMMDFAENSYTYNTQSGEKTDYVRGVPMSVLLDGYNDDDVVSFSTADGVFNGPENYTVKQLIDNDYMLAYEKGSSAAALAGIYETAKNDASIFGLFTLYGSDAKGKPSKMVNKITVTSASGIDFSTSPYKHITNGGLGGGSNAAPYNIDAITGATLTVEGPGVQSSVPVSVRDLEGRDAGAVRADYTDKRDGSNITRTYEGIDLYYILNNMNSDGNGIKMTETAKKVLIKNRNRNTIAEFTVDQVNEAHESETPIIVAYGTSLTSGENIRPFVFDNAAGADPELGNEDGCIKLVYDKSVITDDINTDYTKFGNMAYIYVAEAETPGYKHDKDPYQSADISNYILTVTGEKIGREVNYTVGQLENMVEYDSDGKPDNNGMGYRDEYSLANSNYWYVNEYEGVQLWKLLLNSGLDAALASDDETIVSSTATDGYAATDKFTIKQVADPDSFGFYEKNPEDLNDGTYVGNENIREGNDVSTGDKLRVGYPVLVAYGVNGYPYVEKSSQEGYLSGLQNDGGPLRIISGKLKYNHANGSNQAKYLDKILVGEDQYHYSTHKYHSSEVYKDQAETSGLNIKIYNGSGTDAPLIRDPEDYSVGDIEEYIYGGKLNRVQLGEAKVKNFYSQTKNGNTYSDLYEGVNLSYFLTDILELPGNKGTITFSNGSSDLELNLEDVINAEGTNTATGVEGLVPVIAYSKNGAPLVATKNAEDGYENTVTIAEGTEYAHSVDIKNNGGPLQLVFPVVDGNADMSEKTITGINSITVNLAADNYAHLKAPYDAYKDYSISFSGEGTRLTEAKDFTLSELEGKQKLAFTGDYSLKPNSGAVIEQRFRGIDLYKLLTSSNIGLKTNAETVIIKAGTGSNVTQVEIPVSKLAKANYINSLTGADKLPVILAYGAGKPGTDDMEDGLPLVPKNTTAEGGYDADYNNSDGPVRLVIGQTDADDINKPNCMREVTSIEVTASEMDSWDHNVSEVFRQYLDETVNLQVVDKDGNELMNKDYTVGEIESNTSLVERISAQTTQINTWEGIDFWGFIQQEAAGITGIEDPVTIDVRANDGYSKNIRADFTLEQLQNGIKDGTEYKPILLGYAVDGLPLTTGNPKQQATFPNGEGYDSTVGNNGGPIRLVTHGNQGASISCVTSIKITVGEGSAPEEPADFTIKGLKSGDVELTLDDIKNLKNKAGDNVGQAEAQYVRKGVTKTVKGALLKNILAAQGIEIESAVITLNTPDQFETTDKGASYRDITLKQAVDQNYFLAYQEWDANANDGAGAWKDIDDIVKNTDIHTNLRMYRNYCSANGLDNQNEWLDECSNVTAITVDVPEIVEFKEYPTAAGVRSTYMDKDGTIWVGTYGGGLYYKEAGESELSVLNTSSDPALKTNSTSAVAADAEGGIWVSQNASYTDPTGNQGVLYIKDGEVTQYTVEDNPGTIADNYVQAIKVDTDGKVWFGSFGGVTIYDPAGDTWVTYSKADKGFPAASCNTITLDGEGGAWLGFYPGGNGTEEDPYSGGFCHMDKDGNVDKIKQESGAAASMFAQVWNRSIAIDKKGTVWAVCAGTNIDDNVGGVVWKWPKDKAEPTRFTGKEIFPAYLDGSSTTEVRTVAVDADGSLWFGTSADGVLKVENPKPNSDGTFNVTAQYAKETGSWSAANMNNVYSIDFWNDGTAYVGTAGGLMVLGDEPASAKENAGDATAETADFIIEGKGAAKNGYFSIRGLKNAEGVNRVDATYSWMNKSGTTGINKFQGVCLDNLLRDIIGLTDDAYSFTVISKDGKSVKLNLSQIDEVDKDGNKMMIAWQSDEATAGTLSKIDPKLVIGQKDENDKNKSSWLGNVVEIQVNVAETAEELSDYADKKSDEAAAANAAAETAAAAAAKAMKTPGTAAVNAAKEAQTAAEAAVAAAEAAVAAAEKAVAKAKTDEEKTAAEAALTKAQGEKSKADAALETAKSNVKKAQTEADKKAALDKAKAAYNKAVKAAKAKKVSKFRVKAVKGKKAKLTWKKTKGVKGYVIYRATKKNGKYKKVKTIKKAGTVKIFNKKLKAKKNYYYKMRTYTKIKNPATGKYVTVYGKYTSKKKIKAKK